MPSRTPGHVDLDEDALTVRDRSYESFGEQGVALATYAVPGNEAAHDHTEDGWTRGVDGVRLGDALGEPPRSDEQRFRTDERIHDEICARLTSDGDVEATEIDVIVHEGEVTLSGLLPSRHQVARAIALAEAVRGVVAVMNRLRVSETR